MVKKLPLKILVNLFGKKKENAEEIHAIDVRQIIVSFRAARVYL